jgi:hypothetical protein
MAIATSGFMPMDSFQQVASDLHQIKTLKVSYQVVDAINLFFKFKIHTFKVQIQSDPWSEDRKIKQNLSKKLVSGSAPALIDTILDFRFWILDWAIPGQTTVLEIEIMRLQINLPTNWRCISQPKLRLLVYPSS